MVVDVSVLFILVDLGKPGWEVEGVGDRSDRSDLASRALHGSLSI